MQLYNMQMIAKIYNKHLIWILIQHYANCDQDDRQIKIDRRFRMSNKNISDDNGFIPAILRFARKRKFGYKAMT